jgi:hypothetical protein
VHNYANAFKPRNDTEAPWALIALELDQRAKDYGTFSQERSPFPQDGAFVPLRCLERWCGEPKPNPKLPVDSWNWVFWPLLLCLLHKPAGCRAPYIRWACLGKFVGALGNAKRAWTYYLSEEFTDDVSEGRTRWDRFRRVISFNPRHQDLSKAELLVTPELAEIFNKDASVPGGAPMVITFRGEPLQAASLERDLRPYTLFFDWSDYDKPARDHDRHQRLCRTDDSKERPEEVTRFLKFEPDIARDYVKALRRIVNVASVPRHFDAELHPVPAGQLSKRLQSDAPFHRRLLHYCGWVTDSDDCIGQVIQMHAWLPGEGTSGRSASIILGLGDRRFSPGEFLNMVGAFRAGAVSIAAEASEASGEGVGKAAVLHQLTKDIASVDESIRYHNTELNTFRGLPAFRSMPESTQNELPKNLQIASLAVSTMLLAAATRKTLYEMPVDSATLLYGTWDTECLESFVNGVIWDATLRRIQADTQYIQYRRDTGKSTRFMDVEKELREVHKPQMKIIEPFRLDSPRGVYPLVLLALRAAYQHATLWSATTEPSKRVPPLVQISHSCEACRQVIVIANTGSPPGADRHQSGWSYDLEVFPQEVTFGWTLAKGESVYFDQDQLWKTELQQARNGI